MRCLKSTIFVPLRNFFSCEHRIARFLKMTSVLALVCVPAVFKNHQIKSWIHCVTRLTLFNYLSISGRGSGYLYILTSLWQLSPGQPRVITRPGSYPTDDRKHSRLWLRRWMETARDKRPILLFFP